MKRWVLLTLSLYLLCLSVLTGPLILAFSDQNRELLLGFYIWFVPTLLLVQGVLLLVPLAVIRERPLKRRKIIFSALIGAIPMAALALGFFSAIALMVWGEQAMDPYLYHWPILIIPAISWLVWGLIFYRSFSSQDPKAFTANLSRWLLRGSILELLVAVPSHIISRHREECCAPPLTLLGIATGLAIALLSFGPGVFFLFAQRISAKQGREKRRQ
ncbi:MAG: hypothetical protein HGA96_13385 [Desulfobulbaceae bacterium]|nr:hypothetical protein [Desulfobulbaceae bacterium]